ncbi:hypothetical protein MNBD_GAMMA12-2895 [hydrothermal vent metagenome]|uniref:Uncharacterized protein n=1 Tax=hydrothermal vent metagenome TaxID=652676 RepID=A0A3B0YCX7_9ZZZZ
MRWIRKYSKHLVGFSLAIFVLPLFSIFCQSCLMVDSTETGGKHYSQQHQPDADHSCCNKTEQNSPAMVDSGCCDPQLSAGDTHSVVYVNSAEKAEKAIPVVVASPLVLSNQQVNYRSKGTSLHFVHAWLTFRNPILLN